MVELLEKFEWEDGEMKRSQMVKLGILKQVCSEVIFKI